MGKFATSKGFPALVFVGGVVVILGTALVGEERGWWSSLLGPEQPDTFSQAPQHSENSSTPSVAAVAKIEWNYVGNYPLVRYRGELFYELRNGFFAEVPKDGNMDSRIRVFVPREFRINGEYAAKAAAVVTSDVETFLGPKVINLYGGSTVGYQFELKSGSNLLVIPTSPLLESVFMIQTLHGREPIIGVGEVGP